MVHVHTCYLMLHGRKLRVNRDLVGAILVGLNDALFDQFLEAHELGLQGGALALLAARGLIVADDRHGAGVPVLWQLDAGDEAGEEIMDGRGIDAPTLGRAGDRTLAMDRTVHGLAT